MDAATLTQATFILDAMRDIDPNNRVQPFILVKSQVFKEQGGWNAALGICRPDAVERSIPVDFEHVTPLPGSRIFDYPLLLRHSTVAGEMEMRPITMNTLNADDVGVLGPSVGRLWIRISIIGSSLQIYLNPVGDPQRARTLTVKSVVAEHSLEMTINGFGPVFAPDVADPPDGNTDYVIVAGFDWVA